MSLYKHKIMCCTCECNDFYYSIISYIDSLHFRTDSGQLRGFHVNITCSIMTRLCANIKLMYLIVTVIVPYAVRVYL